MNLSYEETYSISHSNKELGVAATYCSVAIQTEQFLIFGWYEKNVSAICLVEKAVFAHLKKMCIKIYKQTVIKPRVYNEHLGAAMV